MVEVLYIGGSGRSGSTLVQSILGNLPEFQSIGEVQQIWKYLTWENVKCSCNQLISDCPYWLPVLSRLNLNPNLIARASDHTRNLVRTRNLLWLRRIYQDSNRSFSELQNITEALYRSIAQSVPGRIIVDSSKTPSHLLLLTTIPCIEIKVLHLVRDVRAVAYSWNHRVKQKVGLVAQEATMDRRPYLSTTLRWEVENFYTARWSKDRIPYTLMRFEDFTRNPEDEMHRALESLGFRNLDLSLLRDRTLKLKPTHCIGGNPDRFKNSRLIINDRREWQTKLPPVTQIFLGILAAPFLSNYGYPIRPKGPAPLLDEYS